MVLVANCLGIEPEAQGQSGGAQGQLLKVEVEKQTGNYVFRYKDPDDSPVEVVFVPATKIKPEVRATISLDRETRLVLYEYQISNGEASKQELFNFKVKVIPPVENRKWPEGWYGFGPSPATNVADWFQEKGATLVGGLVHRRGLPPGQSQSGFSFQSPNLPGVATAYFRGNTPDWPNPPRLTHEVSREMSKYTWWEYDSVRKPTIGPAIQVSDLDCYDPAVHLQRLQSHLAEQVPEEMLPDARLRADLKKGLARARQALQADHSGEASKQLKALRRRLSVAGAKNISTDLRKALLINLDYLENRLPQAR
ncbi:MAG: hypothetical protein ACRD4U_07440 [Candidatus Acidiferrales bacterium]